MSSYKSPVVLLNEDIWSVWRTDYRGRLMSEGLWYIMSGSPPPLSRGNESSAATDTRTLADDEKTYRLLMESIETSQYQYIEHGTTANAAYTALSDHHEPKTKGDRLALLWDFYGMSWNMKQEPLPEFLARCDVVLRKLRDSDQSITSGMAVDRHLQLMPWELRHKDNGHQASYAREEYLFTANDKPAHLPDSTAMSVLDSQHQVIVDSGASSHMTGDTSNL
ncbi:hypothetical protein DYB25_012350 [Aphanomyces astaci]|uniref:Uncharacterized protein n=2 Tax=Aphanomyces astaci TaxID=112090 RepID=A0A396ZSK5_APHAT|nr:hypothetical protein DYB25_012350 [Aphanomyces astaci]RHY44530.1 hypothetical protein DYB38_013222 [Aphanomyces astaci]RHY89671.1 hypothetical protein DYB26_013882 [Aphanomyces astaci]